MHDCMICKQSFRYATGLERHVQRHKGEGGFICKQCGKKFCSDAERKIHKEAIHNINNCQLCNLKFKKEEEFYAHINKEHDGRDRIYSVCSECGQQFKTNVQLKYHVESRCGTLRQWSCNNCNSKFMTKSSLRAHQLIHIGEKKHLCNYCGSSFLSKGQLKVHERSHTGEKPFSCEVCEKSFAYRESLVTHSSVHTGIKPYLCLACGARFSCIGNLIKHRRTRLNTCGLPQYCTESVKVAPRPSAKRIRNRRPKRKININIESDLKQDLKTEINVKNQKSIESFEPIQKTVGLSHNNPQLNYLNNDIEIKTENIFEGNNDYSIKSYSGDSQYNQEDKKHSLNKLQVTLDQTVIEDKLNDSVMINDIKIETHTTVQSDGNDGIDVLDDNGIEDPNNYDSNNLSDPELVERNEKSDVIDLPTDLFSPTESINGRLERPLFSCKLCLKEYAYLSALEKHEKSHGGVMGTLTENKKEREMKNKQNKSAYSCKFCFKKYLNKSILIKHEEMHGPDGLLLVRCACCPRFFHDTNSCLQHQYAEHKDKLACTPCAKLFKRPELLALHIKREHSDEPIPKKKYKYVCSVCGKRQPSKRALIEHEDSHSHNADLNVKSNTLSSSNKIHTCPKCKHIYSSAASLRSHMTVHAIGGDKLQQLCRYCGKAFRTRGEVKVHERGHSGERPFKCEFCVKAFAYRESLITHRSIHTGYKRHFCSACGARFSCVSNLQAHKRSRKNTCGSDVMDNKNVLTNQQHIEVNKSLDNLPMIT
ncbi:zinc finger protein 16-like isoform X1 [Ctenocephalides felis]|nr:zinc finger protein 16-like isoform X1 [Ctenocephalides felis]